MNEHEKTGEQPPAQKQSALSRAAAQGKLPGIHDEEQDLEGDEDGFRDQRSS